MINKKAQLIGKVLPMLLVMGLFITCAYVLIGNMSNVYNFQIDEDVNRTYNYSDNVISQIRELRTETIESPSLVDRLKEGFLYFILPLRIVKVVLLAPFQFMSRIISDGVNFIGLPEDYAGPVGDIITVIILIAIIVAFASLFVRRPI